MQTKVRWQKKMYGMENFTIKKVKEYLCPRNKINATHKIIFFYLIGVRNYSQWLQLDSNSEPLSS